MYCSKCGRLNADDAAFCQGCGNSLQSADPGTVTVIPAQPAAPVQTAATAAAPKKKANGCLTAFLIIIAIAVFISIIGGIMGGSSSTPDPQVSTSSDSGSDTEQAVKTESKPKLELLSSTNEYADYVNYIVGTVRNNTSRQYSYVQVEINLYDKSGTQIGSTLANANNLEPNATWKFKAVVIEDNVASYKIKDITGW